MRESLSLAALFGTTRINSTKGPCWRINQFAGFSFEPETSASFTAVLRNLASQPAEVTLGLGVTPENSSVRSRALLAAGASQVCIIPSPRIAQSLTIQSSAPLELLEVIRERPPTLPLEPRGAVKIWGLPLSKYSTAYAGELNAGTTGQLSFSGAAKHFLRLAVSKPVQLITDKNQVTAEGFFNMLLEDSQNLYVNAPESVSFSLECQHFSGEPSAAQTASGLPLWII